MSNEDTIEVAALGRPFGLGMLYDCRRDALIPAMTLWDNKDLKEDREKTRQRSSEFEIVASESMEDKSSSLNVGASLKASFLGGLVEVGGSAKYLNDKKTSRHQARVTLTYKTTTDFHHLTMKHLGERNIKYLEVFDKKMATHVVTGILYGAQAFFIFDREVSKEENHQDIQGNMKVMIKKIPCLSIEGEGSLKMEDKDRKKVEKFSCKFYGDFSLQKNPVTFEDAVQVYQSLPTLLGENKENVVPVTVWLLPLTNLATELHVAAKLVREISVGLVQEAQNILEEFSDLEMRYNDALRIPTAKQFPQISNKIKRYKEMCSMFKLNFQKSLAEKLPLIRGGGKEESELAEILKERHSSPFNHKDLTGWINCKDREIYTLKSFAKMMKSTKIIESLNHMFEECDGAEYAVCFAFTSLGSDEPYLSALSNYLRGTTTSDNSEDPHNRDVDKEQWYASKKMVDEVRKKAKLFSDFAEANKGNENIKFLVVGSADENQKGSTIYLYENGFSVSENFEPPSKPESVTVADISNSSVTLKISPPKYGGENITSYLVEFCKNGDEWKQQTVPNAEEVTVSDLSSDTEYLIRCRAVTSAGVGPATQVKASITTSQACSLGEILKRVSKIMQTNFPVVYGLPLKKEDMSVKGCVKYTFGKKSTRQNRTIILLGPVRSGKTTLINAMINYIVGVDWKDDFRFQLINEEQLEYNHAQAYRQTSEITVYQVYHQEGFKIPFSLTIVDTPGFVDTIGKKAFQLNRSKIIEQLGDLFTDKHGVREADAVCLVTPAHLTQHTVTGVFDDVLSIFSKDVEENVRILVTFADDQLPSVLEAINASRVPCPRTDFGLPVYYKVNASAFLANNTGDDVTDNQKFWRMGTKSLASFFDDLNAMKTKSLTITQEILRERKQLEKAVEDWMRHLDPLNKGMSSIKYAAYNCALQAYEDKESFKALKTEYVAALKEEDNLKQMMKRFKEIALKPVPLPFSESIFNKQKSVVISSMELYLRELKNKADYMAKLEKGESHPILAEVKDSIEGRIRGKD